MNYKELDTWVKAKDLVVHIYKITSDLPASEKFGLASQMKRCAVSVPANIAEGVGRRTKADTIRFLYIARGSLYELETHIIICHEVGLVTKKELDETELTIKNCLGLLSGLIRYYKRNTNLK